MSKSKCCNAEIIGKGGNQSQRKYYCSNCKKLTIPTKGAPPPPMKRKQESSKLTSQYLIKWKEPTYDDMTGERFDWNKEQYVKSFTEEELSNFIKNKRKVKIKIIEDNIVPSFDKEELKALEIVIWAFRKNHGSDLNYKMAMQAFNKLQNGVETDNEQPKICNNCQLTHKYCENCDGHEN